MPPPLPPNYAYAVHLRIVYKFFVQKPQHLIEWCDRQRFGKLFRLPVRVENLLSVRPHIQTDLGVHHVIAIWQPQNVTTRRRETYELSPHRPHRLVQGCAMYCQRNIPFHSLWYLAIKRLWSVQEGILLGLITSWIWKHKAPPKPR
jgi:hypothetical protein